MKNLMDFCIGTVVFILIGGALLLGENTLAGFCGRVDWQIITDYSTFDCQAGFSTLYSVQQQQQLFLVPWLKEQSSFHTVFIQELFLQSFIQLKHTGHGVADGLLESDSMTLPDLHVSTW